MAKFIVRNFQSIKEAKLDASGFTIITGESSAGKSALFRALYFSFTNRFRAGCVRNGERTAEIKALFPDGDPIKFTKPCNGSSFITYKDQVYSKLNRTIPSEVEEYLNVAPLSSGEASYNLNFHPQFEKPLLLEFSQRKVLELLSSSQSLSDLNAVKEILASKRAENRGAFRSVDAILTDLKVKSSTLKEQLEHLTPIHTKMEKVYKSLQNVDEKISSLNSLKVLLSSSVSSKIESTTKIISHLQNPPISAELPKTLSTLLTINYHIPQYTELVKVLTNLSALSTNISKVSTLSSILSTKSFKDSRILELNDVVNNHVCPICKSHMNHE